MARNTVDRVTAIACAWAVWVLGTGIFAGLLMIEYGEVGTEPLVLSVSGCISNEYDSVNGVPHWQWNPPGTYCVIERSADIPDRKVFGRPRSWRWGVIALILVTFPLLVWGTVRLAPRAARTHRRRARSRELGAVGGEDGEGVAVVLGGPAGEVHDVMVVVAERDEVGEGGGAAIGPVGDVVGSGPAVGSVTAGVSAAAISDGEGSSELGWDGAAGSADVEG
jgi:hypothetical protein